MNKCIWSKIDKYARKLKAINYLGGKCEKCGENNPFKLCFHHIDSDEKETNIYDIRYLRWSMMIKELDKCKLLCQNCHHEFHYNNDKVNRYKINKKIFLEFKGINGCEKCGYNECDSSLDFHHIEKNKDFILSDISSVYNNVRTLTDKIEEELNKCIVLCRNCHTLEHSDNEFYEKYKIEIIKKAENLKEVQGKIDRNKIKELYNNGMKQVDIAKYFNAKKGTISGIIKELKLR